MALTGTTLLALYLTVMAVLIGGFFFLRKRFRQEEGVGGGAVPVAAGRAQPGAAAAAGGAARPARRGALDRMRRDAGDERKEGGDDHALESGSDGDDDLGDGPIDPRDKKAVRRAEKAAARAAREQVRAQQEAADSHKKQKEDKYAARREAREAEREAAEKEAALVAEQLAAEQRKKDAAEFDEWKDMFTVSDSGTVVADEAEQADQLEAFIRTIQTRKVVVLDELAAEFHMKTPEVIARIQQLEEDGRLTGVLDDRGKFLSITNDEMDAVAKWINRRGRVTIADLVAESNKLIDLNGTAEEDNEQLVLDDDESKEAKST